MKARYYKVDDNKSRGASVGSFWDKIFDNLSFTDYCDSLKYEGCASYLEKYLAGKDKDISILDLGCGAGRHVWFLKNLGFTNVVGVDLSLSGLTKAKTNIKTDFVQADATSLPFADKKFDVVLMVGIVYEIEDKAKHVDVFSEISRLLKENGSCVFVNNSPYNLGERIFTITDKIKNFNSKDVKSFFVWRYSEKDVKEIGKSVGLKIISSFKSGYGMALYRFLYGMFVDKKNREARLKRLKKINPYSENELLVANISDVYFNKLGRILFQKKIFKKIFYNEHIFLLERV